MKGAGQLLGGRSPGPLIDHGECHGEAGGAEKQIAIRLVQLLVEIHGKGGPGGVPGRASLSRHGEGHQGHDQQGRHVHSTLGPGDLGCLEFAAPVPGLHHGPTGVMVGAG